MKLYVPGAKAETSNGEVIIEAPCVHRPFGSSFSNKLNKSNAEGAVDSQNDAGLNAVPELKVLKTRMVTVAVASGQIPVLGTV